MEGADQGGVTQQILQSMATGTAKAYKNYTEEYIAFRGGRPDSEHVVLEWLATLKPRYKASSLWARLSLVKKYLRVEQKFDLGCAASVRGFLRCTGSSETPRHAAAFQHSEVFRYIAEAPEGNDYLVSKLVVGFGVFGGMRAGELTSLRRNDVRETDVGLQVTIRRSKTDQAGAGYTFIVPSGEELGEKVIALYNRYVASMPNRTEDGRLFLQYRGEKFTRQPIGKTGISAIPRMVAEWLGAPEPEAYSCDTPGRLRRV